MFFLLCITLTQKWHPDSSLKRRKEKENVVSMEWRFLLKRPSDTILTNENEVVSAGCIWECFCLPDTKAKTVWLIPDPSSTPLFECRCNMWSNSSSLVTIRQVKWKWSRLSCVRLCDPRLLCPWDFPGKSTRVGCHYLFQRIFPTQKSNPGLPHYKQTLYHFPATEPRPAPFYFLFCATK